MQIIRNFLLNKPLTSSIISVFALILISQLGAVVLNTLFNSVESIHFATLLRYVCGLLVVFVLYHLDWQKDAWINTPYKQWGTKWPLFMLPLASLGIVNLFSVDWHLLQFTWTNMYVWFFDNLSTGVFEETMMRALTFCILLKAWGNTRKGVIKAAMTQAAIFGGVHLLNLMNGFSIGVFAQVIYASLIGFGFAGAVLYTRSIWPAVVVHGFINAMANINRYFEPNFVATPSDPLTYVFLILFIAVIGVIPGYLGIRYAKAIS